MQNPHLLVALAEIFVETIDRIFDREAIGYKLDESNETLVSVSKQLGLTPEQVYKTYIEPFFQPNMDLKTLETLMNLLSRRSHWETSDPYLFQVTPLNRTQAYINLSFLIAQMNDLNLIGLQLDNPKGLTVYLEDRQVLIGYQKPQLNRQCIYCGRLEKDDQGNAFNNKQKLCHSKKCDAWGISNPEEHPDCCFGKWRKAKKTFSRWIERAEKRGASTDEIAAYFRHFCVLRLQSIAEFSPQEPPGNLFRRSNPYPQHWFEKTPEIGQFLKAHQRFPEPDEIGELTLSAL